MAKLNYRTNKVNRMGFTLIEMLVAVSVFSFLAVVSTQILALSLRGVTKSQNIAEARENIDHAVLTIDRLIRSAKSCTDGSSSDTGGFVYQDSFENDVTITCDNDADGIGYIASNSARLTSKVVDIDCTAGVTVISCSQPTGRPGVVEIKITGMDSSHGTSIEGSQYQSSSRTLIRNYSSD